MRLATVCGLSVLLCTACSQPDKSAAKIAELEKQVKALTDAQETLRANTDVLTSRLDGVDQSLIDQFRPTSASFSPDRREFLPIHTAYGVFLVSLANLKPYANGYKAVFNLGNPLSVTFDGAELEFSWGPARAKDVGFADWRKQFRSSTQKITKRLLPGSWNPVEVVLAPADAKDIASISVNSISTSSVLLAAR